MSNECGTMAMSPNTAYFVFEKPFRRLVMVRDKKWKGEILLVCLQDNWKLTLTISPTGLAILDHPDYTTLNRSYLIQCMNARFSSIEFVCFDRLNKVPGCMRRIANFSMMPLLDFCPTAFWPFLKGYLLMLRVI